jgi:hypothetical protein
MTWFAQLLRRWRPVDLQAKKLMIKQILQTAQDRHRLPDLEEMLAVLVGVEELSNYATLVQLALETAAESRGVSMGELKSAYMKFWWQWHNHRDDAKYRAEKVIVLAGEAARVYPDSRIGPLLISGILAWTNAGCPDRSSVLKERLGEVPTLEEIRTYQAKELGI